MVFGFLRGAHTGSVLTPMVGPDKNLGGVLGSTLLAVLFAFEGWTNVGTIAGEMKHPGRDLPRAIVCGVSIIMAVYLVINIAYLRVIPADELMNLESPATAVATRLFGEGGSVLIKVGIIISVIGAGNGFLMSGSRVAYQLSVQKTLPGSATLSKLNDRHVPANAVMLVGALACVYSLTGEFDLLTDLGVFSCWVFYTMTFACVIRLRRTHPEWERKYRVPLYPVIPALAIAGGLFVVASQLFFSGQQALIMSLVSVGITLTGLPVYHMVRMRSNDRTR
jgi:APA family basic amino acid/polyamine antiporter